MGQGHDIDWEQRWASYCILYPTAQTGALRAEAVLLIVAYVVVFAMAPTALLWLWIVPLILGFPVLRLYLLAEHGRCPRWRTCF